ncbi:hypothetical protein ACTHQ4_10080 [Alkalicoccobacillus gibsonii]|uniref:hypothetical protein n=1 Tax=Alkalicoccobacillus gibsonii TaxID=79881 RepID=UPI003F7BBB24
MKKLKVATLVGILAVSFSLGFSTNSAEAATSSWQKVPGAGSSCQVRVWTDASTYTTRATTIDFTLEQKGNCGNLKYIAGFNPDGLSSFTAPNTDGNFSFKTPVKKLSLNHSLFKGSQRSGWVEASLWKNNKTVGVVSSNKITVHKR